VNDANCHDYTTGITELKVQPSRRRGARDYVKAAIVARLEIATVCAAEIVAAVLPVLTFNLNFGDVTEMTSHGDEIPDD
jgi:hypothetical protein